MGTEKKERKREGVVRRRAEANSLAVVVMVSSGRAEVGLSQVCSRDDGAEALKMREEARESLECGA